MSFRLAVLALPPCDDVEEKAAAADEGMAGSWSCLELAVEDDSASDAAMAASN